MKKITLFTLLTLLLCTSCVTKKKFMLAEMAATASKDSLQGLLNNSREVGNQLSAQVKNLLRDTTKMGNSIRQYQSMLNVNMTEQEKLNALLSQKKNELNERERTINELQDMIKAQNDKVQNLLSNVKDALLGFSTDELTVREKDGKVYVAMSDKLLFQSGSARLDKRGEEALGKLAEVLNKQTDIFLLSLTILYVCPVPTKMPFPDAGSAVAVFRKHLGNCPAVGSNHGWREPIQHSTFHGCPPRIPSGDNGVARGSGECGR